jgi:hypothetical protein
MDEHTHAIVDTVCSTDLHDADPFQTLASLPLDIYGTTFPNWLPLASVSQLVGRVIWTKQFTELTPLVSTLVFVCKSNLPSGKLASASSATSQNLSSSHFACVRGWF